MKRTRIDILVRTAVLPALILMMSLTGCSLVMDDDTRTPSDGKATLILNIATSRKGTPGIGTSSPTRGVTVTPDDYYGPETGELMRPVIFTYHRQGACGRQRPQDHISDSQ